MGVFNLLWSCAEDKYWVLRSLVSYPGGVELSKQDEYKYGAFAFDLLLL
mgnify:CR=1 FL=1